MKLRCYALIIQETLRGSSVLEFSGRIIGAQRTKRKEFENCGQNRSGHSHRAKKRTHSTGRNGRRRTVRAALGLGEDTGAKKKILRGSLCTPACLDFPMRSLAGRIPRPPGRARSTIWKHQNWCGAWSNPFRFAFGSYRLSQI